MNAEPVSLKMFHRPDPTGKENITHYTERLEAAVLSAVC